MTVTLRMNSRSGVMVSATMYDDGGYAGTLALEPYVWDEIVAPLNPDIGDRVRVTMKAASLTRALTREDGDDV